MISDLNISGMGQIASGSYNNVNIAGTSKILGNIKASSVNVSGTMKSKGSIECDEFLLSGTFKSIEGIKSTGIIDINGMFKGEKEINANTINVNGMFRVFSNVKFDNATIAGYMRAKGDVEGRDFNNFDKLNNNFGRLNIEGLLSADIINIELNGRNKIGEIGGEKITVKASENNSYFGLFSRKVLVTKTIEGDEIFLENTKADVVRGKNITIGKGCFINRVEYTESINVCKDTTVKEEILVK